MYISNLSLRSCLKTYLKTSLLETFTGIFLDEMKLWTVFVNGGSTNHVFTQTKHFVTIHYAYTFSSISTFTYITVFFFIKQYLTQAFAQKYSTGKQPFCLIQKWGVVPMSSVYFLFQLVQMHCNLRFSEKTTMKIQANVLYISATFLVHIICWHARNGPYFVL